MFVFLFYIFILDIPHIGQPSELLIPTEILEAI